MVMELADLRMEYDVGTLDAASMDPDPMAQWRTWFEAAVAAEVFEPNAMVVATVDPGGWPQARNVLAKEVDADGFVFYTNYESAKAAELESSAKASLLFSWLPMHRQIRVVGTVSRVSAAQSDAYFASRPRGSQLGSVGLAAKRSDRRRGGARASGRRRRRQVRRRADHPSPVLGWLPRVAGHVRVLARPTEPAARSASLRLPQRPMADREAGALEALEPGSVPRR